MRGFILSFIYYLNKKYISILFYSCFWILNSKFIFKRTSLDPLMYLDLSSFILKLIFYLSFVLFFLFICIYDHMAVVHA